MVKVLLTWSIPTFIWYPVNLSLYDVIFMRRSTSPSSFFLYSHTPKKLDPCIFWLQKKEHGSKPLNPKFQPFLTYFEKLVKWTFGSTVKNHTKLSKKTMFACFHFFDAFKFFSFICHLIEQNSLYKTAYIVYFLNVII